MKYELKNNKYGTYFIKNHKYWYLDQFEVWGLDTQFWYDTIEYNFFKVNFIEENGIKYIKLKKTDKPIKNI